MFNLLKSDIYRLVHGKMLWVAAIVLVALSVLAAGMMHWSSPEFLRMTATSFEMTVNVGDGATGAADVLGEGDAAAANASAEAAAAAGASGRGLSLDELDTLGAAEAAGSAESEEDSVRDDETASDSAFASSELWDLVADNPEALSDADFEGVSRDMRTLASPADMLGDGGVGRGVGHGRLAGDGTLLAQDFHSFARMDDRRGRVRYYGEKLVLVGLLAAFYLAVAALAGAASFAAAGFTYAAASPLGDLALFLGLAWLLAFAYGCTTAVIVWASRSAGAGVAWALVVSSGIAGSLLGQVLLLLGQGEPWIGALEPWMLASCMQNVGNHASTLLATPAAAPLTMAPLAVQVLIVGTAAVALCVVLTFGPLWKRDL
ncbi:MAG: hypothetical protein ACLSGS_11220 [Adlercreutzia sp.]